ncbi:MAG: hypothetical protein U9Q77_01295 [Candidatus Marinimicrobia bacterium]|nr:hypothetical protein [Candidatus Neomarinimicrobiota bacterium]
MKQIIMWSLMIVALFVVLIAVAFFALGFMTPDPNETGQTLAVSENELASTDTTQGVQPKISKADSLQIIINDLTNTLFFARVTLDSLNDELSIKEGIIQGHVLQVESLKSNLQTLQDKHVSIKELAKTYETMKVAEIKPILERVDDKTIIAIYQNMSGRSRKNLMKALNSERAAHLTIKLAG